MTTTFRCFATRNRGARPPRTALPGFLAVVLMVAAASAAEPAVPDPAASGAELAAGLCAGCHGKNGNAPPGAVPNLAAQPAPFLRRQLRSFKSHGRSDEAAAQNMWRIAHDLGERQIDELATWFAARKLAVQPAQGTQDQIAAGQAIFARGAVAHGVPPCRSCHGSDGRGRDDAPRLAGQNVDYLVSQLHVFQSTNDRPGATAMRSVSHDLAADDIVNVAAYLQALPGIGVQ